jgi:ketosteroid isomerase-like protein
MEAAPITTSDHLEAVRSWFELLGRYCAAVDYDAGETIFAEDAVAFGTRARVVKGRDYIRKNQWEGIWGNIRDFTVDLEQVAGGGSGDTAWGMTTWTSTGFDESGSPYFRPGRATVVLQRRNGRWLCVHSHFSLAPGTPQVTYGAGEQQQR